MAKAGREAEGKKRKEEKAGPVWDVGSLNPKVICASLRVRCLTLCPLTKPGMGV